MMELLVLISYNIALAIFVTLFLIKKKRYANLIYSVAQLIIEKKILLDKLEQIELANSKEVNDEFIKFLSQSREAAFKYIEDVQLSIQEYLDAVNANDLDRIAIARMALFSHLPDRAEENS